jgi:hypothetical protein
MPYLGSRRWSEDGQHEQASIAGVLDTMRHSIGSHQEIARLHRQVPAFKQENALTVDHVIHFVRAGVGVQRMRLARLKSVQADQQPGRFVDGTLAHLVGPPLGVIRWSDDCRMRQHIAINCNNVGTEPTVTRPAKWQSVKNVNAQVDQLITTGVLRRLSLRAPGVAPIGSSGLRRSYAYRSSALNP